jgi:hypothetical protein
MRWLFLFVLSLNIAYIVWQINVPEVAEYTDAATTKNTKSIVLLSELKAVENSTQSVEQSDSAPPENTKQDVSEKIPDVDDKEAVGVKKAMVSASKKSEVIDITAKDVQAGNQANNCFTIGPFRDIEKLRGFVREIRSYVVKADFRDREEKERSVYWVYIKPEKNRKSAIETGRRLKAKKIKDFYIIREGEKNNGISLGHFKNKKRAYGLAKKVKKLGFDVSIEPIFKSYALYWLDYQLVSGKSIPEAINNQYLRSKSKDKISQLSRDCET